MAHRCSKEELDEQFEEFLKESLSDDSPGNSEKKSSVLDTLGQPRKKETKQKDAVPWWLCEEDLDDGEILETSERIVKKALQLTEETDENVHPEKMQLQKSNGVAFSLSRDSLETNDSFVASGPNQSNTGLGLDTLEEQEEKEIFFAKLEQEASSPIDYSRLNKELNLSDSIVLAPFVRNESEKEVESTAEEKCESYSEDFEEDTDANPMLRLAVNSTK